MLQGDLEAAWLESDALRRRGASDPHRFWDGQSLTGKRVIVRCLHGFGDAVQMLRYAPMLAAIAESVVWEVAPPFVELARCFNGVQQVVTWGEAAPAVTPPWDNQVEVMELPYIFRTVRSDLPIAERYCHIPAAELQRVRARLRTGPQIGPQIGPRIGLVWAAGDWNTERSVPFTALEPLLAQHEMWSLQGGNARTEAPGLRDATAEFGDGLPALAAVIAGLDLVLTVDTLAAHLAGALGTPVWVMLQRNADWRWQAEGYASAWYPSMRLFRQTQQGDWPGVVARICEELT